MAFRVHAEIKNAEFRRYRETPGKDGKNRLYVKFEDYDGNDFEVSVSDPQLIENCRNLVKAFTYDLDVLFNATSDYSFIALLSVPTLVYGD